MNNSDPYRPPKDVFSYPSWTSQPASGKFLLQARGFLENAGVISASYRRVARFHSQLGEAASLHHFGFPENWVKLYDDNLSFREQDPIANFIMRAGRFMSWKEAIAAQDLSALQQDFVNLMQEHGLIDGVALPLYGPRGREAYATYSFGRETRASDLQKILVLNDFFQLRHAELALVEDAGWIARHPLSNREREVLFWIAKGKSNQDIADILGLSVSTVAEYLKRIFFKFEVFSRMDAVGIGLHRGVINLSSHE